MARVHKDTDEIEVFDILFGPSGRAPGEGDHWPLHNIFMSPGTIGTNIAEFSGDGKWGWRDL